MTIAFRDSTVVVIETGRTLIRAGIGLAELLKTPSLVRLSSSARSVTERNLKAFSGNPGARWTKEKRVQRP